MLCLSAPGENLSVKYDFLLGLELPEMPCFKGFCVLASTKWKFIFIHGKFFIGNLLMPCECLSVAGRNA